MKRIRNENLMVWLIFQTIVKQIKERKHVLNYNFVLTVRLFPTIRTKNSIAHKWLVTLYWWFYTCVIKNCTRATFPKFVNNNGIRQVFEIISIEKTSCVKKADVKLSVLRSYCKKKGILKCCSCVDAKTMNRFQIIVVYEYSFFLNNNLKFCVYVYVINTKTYNFRFR